MKARIISKKRLPNMTLRQLYNYSILNNAEIIFKVIDGKVVAFHKIAEIEYDPKEQQN